jgi:hypothetical protein
MIFDVAGEGRLALDVPGEGGCHAPCIAEGDFVGGHNGPMVNVPDEQGWRWRCTFESHWQVNIDVGLGVVAKERFAVDAPLTLGSDSPEASRGIADLRRVGCSGQRDGGRRTTCPIAEYESHAIPPGLTRAKVWTAMSHPGGAVRLVGLRG